MPNIVFTNYYPNDTAKTISGQNSFGIGIQLQTELIFKPVYDFGFGIIPFVNINTVQSVAGFTFCIYGSNAMTKKMR